MTVASRDANQTIVRLTVILAAVAVFGGCAALKGGGKGFAGGMGYGSTTPAGPAPPTPVAPKTPVAAPATLQPREKTPAKPVSPVPVETVETKANIKTKTRTPEAKKPDSGIRAAHRKTRSRPEKVAVTRASPKPSRKPVSRKSPVAKKPPIVASSPSPPLSATPAPLELTAAQLPFTRGNWTLQRNWDNLHPGVCRLVSKRQTMDDGYDKTAVWAEIRASQIAILTRSNIDLSYQGTGIQFDDSPAHPIGQLVGKTGVMVAGDFSHQLGSAQALKVHLGFWPTWPKTRLQEVSIPLGPVHALIPAFLDCKHL